MPVASLRSNNKRQCRRRSILLTIDGGPLVCARIHVFFFFLPFIKHLLPLSPNESDKISTSNKASADVVQDFRQCDQRRKRKAEDTAKHVFYTPFCEK